jgi:16S rRNA (guanine527-N7)-methyltransferase
MSPRESLAPIRTLADFAEAFAVSRETLEKLETYASLLAKWQRTINLVAPSTLPEVWGRHFADSAQLLRFAPPEARSWVDLGSGAGFPGMVAALMLAGKGARVTLIESDTRKAAFLAEVARATGAPVDISRERIEMLPTHTKVEPIDVVSARALAPLPRLFELAAPYFSTRTVGIFPKGREAKGEVEAAREDWDFAVALHPSLTAAGGHIAVVRGLKAKASNAKTEG